MEAVRGDSIEWGLATLALAGQIESGDRHIVQSFEGGVLVGVVDGLGHGREAAAAASAGVLALEGHAQDPLQSLFTRCHEALKTTRGAAMSLASIRTEDGMMTWLGVGNVNAVALCQGTGPQTEREFLTLRPGVVGFRLPRLNVRTHQLKRGDTLIFASDGIRPDFAQVVRLDDSPTRIANEIIARHIIGHDDALVLVVRYQGGTA